MPSLHDNEVAASLARIEQKFDSFAERLLNGGTGLIPAIQSKQTQTDDDVVQLKLDQTVLETQIKRDAKWWAVIGSAISVACGTIVHFTWHH